MLQAGEEGRRTGRAGGMEGRGWTVLRRGTRRSRPRRGSQRQRWPGSSVSRCKTGRRCPIKLRPQRSLRRRRNTGGRRRAEARHHCRSRARGAAPGGSWAEEDRGRRDPIGEASWTGKTGRRGRAVEAALFGSGLWSSAAGAWRRQGGAGLARELHTRTYGRY
jgi:hypothetical protein